MARIAHEIDHLPVAAHPGRMAGEAAAAGDSQSGRPDAPHAVQIGDEIGVVEEGDLARIAGEPEIGGGHEPFQPIDPRLRIGDQKEIRIVRRDGQEGPVHQPRQRLAQPAAPAGGHLAKAQPHRRHVHSSQIDPRGMSDPRRLPPRARREKVPSPARI